MNIMPQVNVTQPGENLIENAAQFVLGEWFFAMAANRFQASHVHKLEHHMRALQILLPYEALALDDVRMRQFSKRLR